MRVNYPPELTLSEKEVSLYDGVKNEYSFLQDVVSIVGKLEGSFSLPSDRKLTQQPGSVASLRRVDILSHGQLTMRVNHHITRAYRTTPHATAIDFTRQKITSECWSASLKMQKKILPLCPEFLADPLRLLLLEILNF